ncbi:MAG: TIGR02117 family protein [Flavobacteriales bacterium]
MGILRLVLRLLSRLLLALLVFITGYALAAWLLPMIPANSGFVQPDGGQLIYLHSNGVHTDVVLPLRSTAKDWTTSLPFSNTESRDSSATHVAFGWGDKGFYLETKEWADLKASTAFKAAFGLSGSAMHVTFCNAPTVGADCKAVRVDDATLQGLVSGIEEGFTLDPDGKPIWIANRYYGATDSFYEGTGSYGLFFTCNTWTNSTLKECGLPAATWTVLDGGILRQYSEP